MVVHEDRYVAEIRVETNPDVTSWAPYRSAIDAERLDAQRATLHRNHLLSAGTLEHVYAHPTAFAAD